MSSTQTTNASNKAGKGKAASNNIANIKVTPENKCDLCTGSICCTYITHEIDKPKKMKEYDYLLWQVSHENIGVFKDDDGWFMSIKQSCTHLKADGGCGIYEVRPDICRDHSNDSCEFDGPAEEDFDLYFDGYESLDKYCREKFKNWDGRHEKWANKKKEKELKKKEKKAKKEAA